MAKWLGPVDKKFILKSWSRWSPVAAHVIMSCPADTGRNGWRDEEIVPSWQGGDCFSACFWQREFCNNSVLGFVSEEATLALSFRFCFVSIYHVWSRFYPRCRYFCVDFLCPRTLWSFRYIMSFLCFAVSDAAHTLRISGIIRVQYCIYYKYHR